MGDKQLVAIFKALANPHRLEIFKRSLEFLPRDGVVTEEESKAASCQREMADELGLAPSTLSHHFKELKHAGLLNIERDGQTVSWSLNQDGIRRLTDFLQQIQNGK